MELDGLWSYRQILLMGIASFLLQILVVVSLNDEGRALLRFKDRIENDPFGALLTWKESSLENHPCSWYGVDCVDGHVVSLKLKDLCLGGTLAPELAHLAHIKLIVLRNNSLSGSVPEELTGLKELEVLDLGFNNFSGTLPHEWGNNVALLCDHQTKESMHRRELQENDTPIGLGLSPEAPPTLGMPPPPPSPRRNPRDPLQPSPSPPATAAETPPPPSELETPPPSSTSPDANTTKSNSAFSKSNIPIIATSASVGAFLLALTVALFIWRRKKNCRCWAMENRDEWTDSKVPSKW